MQERNTNNVPNLFSSVEVGPLVLRNLVVMAPLTRSRAGPGNVQGYTDYPILREVAPHACYHDTERAWG